MSSEIKNIVFQDVEIPRLHSRSIHAPNIFPSSEIKGKVSLQSIKEIIDKSLKPLLENQQNLLNQVKALSDRIAILEEAQADFYLKSAEDAIMLDYHREAIKYAKKGLNCGSNYKETNAHLNLILSFAFRDLDQKKALEAAQAGLKCECDHQNMNAILHMKVFDFFYKAKDYDSALKAAKSAVECGPSVDMKAKTYIEIANTYHAMGKYEDAVKAAQDGLNQGSSDGDINIELHYRLTLLLANNLNRLSEAAKVAEEGLHFETSDKETFQQLSLTLKKLKRELKKSKKEET